MILVEEIRGTRAYRPGRCEHAPVRDRRRVTVAYRQQLRREFIPLLGLGPGPNEISHENRRRVQHVFLGLRVQRPRFYAVSARFSCR